MSETYYDLNATFERGATLKLTPEERRSLAELCAKIVGKHFIPAYRLAESQEKKKAADATAETAERKVIKGALRS